MQGTEVAVEQVLAGMWGGMRGGRGREGRWLEAFAQQRGPAMMSRDE